MTDWDGWYAQLARSSVRDDYVNSRLGLPTGSTTNNLLPGCALPDIVAGLRTTAGQLLLDLACGRGGWGITAAASTGARLVGLDVSGVAVGLARQHAADAGVPAHYLRASMTATGLRAKSVDAVLCLDALQFARPPAAALIECRRVLRPGGRLVVTWWEPVLPDDPRLTPRTRQRQLDRELHAAGFGDVLVVSRPDWYATEEELWRSLVAAPATSDGALSDLQEEARIVLQTFDQLHRVLAIAAAPT